MTHKRGKYYVYGLYYPDEMGGTCFYIGKGSGYRIMKHEYEASEIAKDVNPYKCRVIRKIWANGLDVGKKKLAHFDIEDEALMYEQALIFFMRGQLTNLTDGGENGGHSEETRRKISNGLKGQTRSGETRRKISETLKGKALTEETKLKMSLSRKGRLVSEETRRKISESHKGIGHTEEARRKMSETRKGRLVSEETRQKLRESQLRRKGL